MSTLHTLAAALAVAAAILAAPAATSAPVPAFAEHTIATGLRGGYQVVVADLNKDGKPDIIALAQGLPELVWFQNPGWERHVIVSGVRSMINVTAADLDGDGIPELALAQGFSTRPATSAGIVSLLTHGPDPAEPWTMKEIDRVPTAHRLRWIDADGSGKKMLVVGPLVGPDARPPDYRSPNTIFFYRAPDWKREIVTDALTGLIHGVEPMPWPGVRGQVLMTAGFVGIYLHRYAGGRWMSTELSKGDPQPWPRSGTSDIALGHLGRRRFIATIEPWHGNEIVIYQEVRGAWERHPIDDGITDGHAIVTLDADGDGRDEVVVGQRGGERSLILYRASKDGWSWSRTEIDHGGMAGAGCAVADLNGDKRPDIVCIGTGTANLKWYENVSR